MERNVLSLAELNSKVQQGIKAALPSAYWIRAEIAELKENASGHCYLELIEKGNDDKIIAKARGIIWSFSYRMIKPYFYSTAKRYLSEGLKVMVQVTVEFHELYGYSLVIKDIDPSYTVGDIALKKMQIIQQLKDEGVFDMNREIPLTLVPQRIAVISSQTAAGYEDFTTHLQNNTYNYSVKWKLYNASMQGNDTEKSIITALDQINQVLHRYDAVVIIRGGGSQSDLSSFDSYWLAYHITQFPIPVITGIGHEQDDSVVDLVAHTRLKTPTAVAEFILSKFAEFENLVDEQQERLTDIVSSMIDEQTTIINTYSSKIPLLVKEKIYQHKQLLQQVSTSLKFAVLTLINISNQRLKTVPVSIRNAFKSLRMRREHKFDLLKKTMQHSVFRTFSFYDKKIALIENTVTHSDPINVMQKGYSITTFENKIIKDSSNLKSGDEIETVLHKGKIKSKVS